jgi:putative NADPH-quinone reductase
MKNILIISAHPSKQGRTHRIVTEYKTACEANGHQVTVLDLYVPENALPFLSFETMREWPVSETQDRMKSLVSAADELVFVHPIWWGMAPAIVKNWVDVIFEAGFAFKYRQDGGWDKLLKGKTAKVFATSGAPSFVFLLPLFPFRSFWKNATLGFCGVKVTDIKVCGGMNSGTTEEQSKKLELFLTKVRKLAVK